MLVLIDHSVSPTFEGVEEYTDEQRAAICASQFETYKKYVMLTIASLAMSLTVDEVCDPQAPYTNFRVKIMNLHDLFDVVDEKYVYVGPSDVHAAIVFQHRSRGWSNQQTVLLLKAAATVMHIACDMHAEQVLRIPIGLGRIKDLRGRYYVLSRNLQAYELPGLVPEMYVILVNWRERTSNRSAIRPMFRVMKIARARRQLTVPPEKQHRGRRPWMSDEMTDDER